MNLRLKGFTLIELIVVIGIIAILAGITIVAVNPSRQFAQARNTQRRSDTLALLNSIHQYSADNSGNFPSLVSALTASANCGTDFATLAALTNTSTGIGATSGTNYTTGALIETSVSPNYISAAPTDPGASGAKSDYYICRDSNNKISVYATKTDIITGSQTNLIRSSR